MKKILLSIAFIAFSLVSFSQVFFSDTMGNPYSNDFTIGLPIEEAVYFDVNNTEASVVTYSLEVIEISVPAPSGGFTPCFEICVPGVCVPDITSTMQVGPDFDVSSPEELHLTFLAFGIEGDAYIKLKITNRNNVTDTAIINFDTQLYVGLPEKTIQTKIEISPNPATNYINVAFTDSETNQITIFDMLGKKVSEFRTNSSSDRMTIDVSSYPKGIYILKTGNTFKKFIIE
ncbi:MAG: T9SS type A sorting domain-containing protein [Bacteroidales bacterium]|nr:T9SS type A sorting domain-containing protein [Bacteroidales bacterium]